MSGPENPRGGDAFDDFFGDPTPSGRMGPVSHASDAAPFAEDEPTQDVELRRRTQQPTQAAAPVPPIQPEPTPRERCRTTGGTRARDHPGGARGRCEHLAAVPAGR